MAYLTQSSSFVYGTMSEPNVVIHDFSSSMFRDVCDFGGLSEEVLSFSCDDAILMLNDLPTGTCIGLTDLTTALFASRRRAQSWAKAVKVVHGGTDALAFPGGLLPSSAMPSLVA